VATVFRARQRALRAARYPGYGWERNQGYATKEHRDAIRKLGLTPYHRRSFLALQRTLAGDQISLDLFDEAVASVEAEADVRELDRLDGFAVVEPGVEALAAIAEVEAMLLETPEPQAPQAEPGVSAA
jgi:hypothetical protein